MIALNDMQSKPTEKDVEVLNATTSVTTRDDDIEMSNTANTSSNNNDNDIKVSKSTADIAARTAAKAAAAKLPGVGQFLGGNK